MDSGFAGGEDEVYNVYDQPFGRGRDMAQSIYRPSKNTGKDVYGDDLDTLMQSTRYLHMPLSYQYTRIMTPLDQFSLIIVGTLTRKLVM